MKPRIVELKSKQLVGLNQEMSLVDNKTFELWKNFRQRSKNILNKSSQDFISLQIYPKGYFETFSPAKRFVKWACVEVDDNKSISTDFQSLNLEGGLYAVFDYKGTAESAPAFFQYIYGEWIPKSDYILDDRPHFEVLSDKYKNNDPASEEEIWIPIKAK
ncbi:GyrI-like domain-containing protein [Maribacter stanieri]|uniref:AraC family transcriptional regulator n=1 Tax=Maribacter stanieri TaxID=440514 RepID=A0A1I6INR3_9FLAO|nr:GyrI-like domain-containing protein [Maribacter stanieri]SFR68356.1 AraC family transcriptional regulator [Maribacter stanieri]